MLKHLKIHIFISIILAVKACTLSLYAQRSESVQEITRFLYSNIPVQNQNWCISRNPVNGLVYFANSYGLGEYNGISLKMYNLPYRESIRSVHVSEEGIIYTGAFEEFGYWRDSTDGNLVYKSLSRNIVVEKNDEIWKIIEFNDNVYFQSFTTVYIWDHKVVKPLKAPFTMLFLFQAGNNLIAQILGNGLYRFDGDKFEFIPGSEKFSWFKVHSIFEASEKEIWVCTANNGIYRFDGTHFTYFDSEISDFLIYQTCNAGLAIDDSLFVFGTILNGIVLCNINGEIFNNFNYTNGLKNNTVLSLFMDAGKGLWIGLDDGANYFNVTSPRTLYANLSGNLGTIYAIITENDRLYLGTNHGLFEAIGEQVNGTYNFKDVRIIPQTQGQVWTLGRYDNQILCGHNDGTFLLEKGRVSKISDITGGWSIKEYNDLLIQGTYTGIVLFRKDSEGRWTFRNKIKGFSEPTRHLEADYLGYIWASHPQKGFYKLELNEAVDSVINLEYFNAIEGMPADIDIYKVNNQIVFTTSGNIYTYDYDQRSIIPFDQLNNSLEDYRATSQIVHDTRNNYWFNKGNKISLFEISKDFIARKKLEINQKFSELPERELNIIRLSPSTIIIPSREAFVTINLPLMEIYTEKQKPEIRKLVFTGKKNQYHRSGKGNGPIKIPHNTNNLTVFISDLSGFDSDGKEYRYRLPGFDDTWHSTSTDNFTYLNLKQGNYRLQVKSVLNNETDEINFTIGRPWYMTIYAYLIYIILFASAIITAIRIFRNELRKQKQLIEFEISNNKLASELDFKSYELMLTMRYLIQKNEILSDLNEQINSIKEKSSNFPLKFIREMEKIINTGHKQTGEWKNSLNSLKLTQQGFYKRLIEKHPDLTPNDLRLCSYLLMNFTTKEIARLLNISERGVEVSRYRLRRKMNLLHDVNLTEYLIRESDTM